MAVPGHRPEPPVPDLPPKAKTEEQVRQPLFLAGATASGKTAAAIEIARRCGGEIVNADAFQLYRGLDILTAKPTAGETAVIPHHLYSVLEPAESFSAARYEAMARPVIDEVRSRGKQPIVVGGSGLYIKALTHGLSPLPSADPALRAELESLELGERVNRLLELDPGSETEIDLANPRYVTRALEICILTGQPASVLQRQWAARKVHFNGIFLQWDRETLYGRINRRTEAMIADGAVQEVARCTGSSSHTLSDTAEKAIGVREIRSHLAGECTLEETVSAIQQATRRYAKRQMTWFKREAGFKSICLTDKDDASSLAEEAISLFPELVT